MFFYIYTYTQKSRLKLDQLCYRIGPMGLHAAQCATLETNSFDQTELYRCLHRQASSLEAQGGAEPSVGATMVPLGWGQRWS